MARTTASTHRTLGRRASFWTAAAVAALALWTSGAPSVSYPLYPLAPLITIGALGYIAWTNWLDVETGRPALLATVAQIAVAAGYYWFLLHRRGDWTAFVPSDTQSAPPPR